MTDGAKLECPAIETLAAFAEGRLSAAERAAVVEHLDTCDECTREVALGMQAFEEDRAASPRRWTPWLAAIAAALVIAIVIPAIRTFRRSPIDRLVALTPRDGRAIQPRLTGGFAWSPYRGSERESGSVTSDPARMKLMGEAGELVQRAGSDKSAEAQHAAGVAMLLAGDPAGAIGRLETAAKESPAAQTWSDLAAARYAAASELGRAALYSQALAAADAALRLDPNLPEALFNRALVLDRMGLAAEARTAWNRYLAVDPSSRWAEEARAHLSELPAATTSSRWEHDRPLIESALSRNDAATAHALIAEHAPRARTLAETEFLGHWAAAVLRGDEPDAQRWLTFARTIGEEISRDGQETLLRDAVKTIDDASSAKRRTIAEAQSAYTAGRQANGRRDLDEAARQLESAAALFEQSGSPMALNARFWLASVGQAKNAEGSRADLDRLLADADAKPAYRSLRAYVRWETGRARMFDYDWTGAATLLSAGAALFREGNDRVSEATVETMLASCLAAAGRSDDAWKAQIEALRALSAEGNRGRLTFAVGSAVRNEKLAGRDDVALALARLPESVPGDAVQDASMFDLVQFRSLLETTMGDGAGALRDAQHAARLAGELTDASLRSRRIADADVALGAALSIASPREAIAPLSRAIDYYRSASLAGVLPEPLLLRARSALRAGDRAASERDLEEGMEIVERHAAGRGLTSSVLDADHALFTDAIGLALERGDEAKAFAISERSHGASTTYEDVQNRLRGSATAIVEIALLANESVTFAVTENDLRVGRGHRKIAEWGALAESALTESGTAAATALYDDLLRPVDGVFPAVRNVIVVPDERLETVPFAALYDKGTGRYLIERTGVAIAPNAGTLRRETFPNTLSVVTFALPPPNASAPALPEAERELGEIASLYGHATAVAPRDATLARLLEAEGTAGVVHIAGHTEREAAGEHALLLARTGGGDPEPIPAAAIAASHLARAGIVVLAACNTMRPPASSETHARSLAAAFVAAGAPAVIGTLTPVADREARMFFREMHRHLAAGSSPIDAVRAAQIAAIREGGESRTWRSMALLTSRIATSKG
jgi:CHAT domain-containing protein